MALIPEYNPINYGARPLDFGLVNDFADQLVQKHRAKEQEERVRGLKLQDALYKVDPASAGYKPNVEKAELKLNQLHDKVANMLTYDDNKKVKSGHGEPQLSDKQYSELMFDVKGLQTELTKYRTDYEAANKFQEDYKKNPESFDKKTVENILADWTSTGIWSNPTADQIIASKNPYEIFNDNYAKKSLGWDPKPVKTISKDGMKEIITYEGLPQDVQYRAYYDAAQSDVGTQKGLIDLMLTSGKAQEEIKAYYLGDLLGGDILKDKNLDEVTQDTMMDVIQSSIHPQALQEAQSHVNKAINDYMANRKIDPTLAEAAINFGASNLKLHERIGKGQTAEDPNIGLYNARLKEGWDKAEDAKKKQEAESSIQEKQITFGGVQYNKYVDLSNVEPVNTTLKGFKLPEGSKRYLEKVDPKTGEVTPYEVGGKKGQAVRISDPPEMKKEIDYRVSGFDKDANVIRLVKTEPTNVKTDESEFFTVPLRGNEYLLKEPVKKLGVSEDYLKTGTPKSKEGVDINSLRNKYKY